ncbi:hypothetical protein AB205_0040050, partial [Aquarana catesbeiana]
MLSCCPVYSVPFDPKLPEYLPTCFLFTRPAPDYSCLLPVPDPGSFDYSPASSYAELQSTSLLPAVPEFLPATVLLLTASGSSVPARVPVHPLTACCSSAPAELQNTSLLPDVPEFLPATVLLLTASGSSVPHSDP